jgi:hypothetical protein
MQNPVISRCFLGPLEGGDGAESLGIAVVRVHSLARDHVFLVALLHRWLDGVLVLLLDSA